MMARAGAVISLSSGNRLLSSSFYASDTDHLLVPVQIPSVPLKNFAVVAQKSSNLNSSSSSNRTQMQAIKAIKEHVHTPITSTSEEEIYDPDLETSLEAMVLLQKSLLEKQWKLRFDFDRLDSIKVKSFVKEEPEMEGDQIISSGTNARQRRTGTRRKNHKVINGKGKETRYIISQELLPTSTPRGNLKKGIFSEELLSQDKVVYLCKKMKDRLFLEKHRKRLKEKLGFEPSDKELAHALNISCPELKIRLLEGSLAKEKLTNSNVRLVKSIALKYDNMGADMDDLIQGGLVGLLRGIEKYDPSKGYKVSTYVYWWIRQGITKALAESSGTLRIPIYLYERLGKIHNAKISLEQDGLAPTVENIAQYLNMSEKKVQNATEVNTKVHSLDWEAFPTLGGPSGNTLHNYIQDRNPENDPWHAFRIGYIKEEVNKLIDSTLNKRERKIIRSYHGIGGDCLTWVDIGKQFGLSRERVRQVGLVAMEKLKHAARNRDLEALLTKF
ncbi:sigma factor A [Carex rostrata]